MAPVNPADRPAPGSWLTLLWVAPDGLVHSGRLTTDPPEGREEAPTLVSRTGRIVAPDDVLALLAPCRLTEDQRGLLRRASRAGYRVEEA